MTFALRVEAAGSMPAMYLRPWVEEDIPALTAECRDAAFRRGTGLALRDNDDAVRWLKTQQRGWEAGDRFSFAVLEPDEEGGFGTGGRLVAHVVLKTAAPTGPTAEVGYWTATRARGRGVAPRALKALTTWAFETFAADGLQRLELLHQVDNPASCRVAAKTGYEFVRVLPAHPPAFPAEGHLHVRTAG
ncbi:GNAT family N-acetyltransferase [Streptomyces flavidovirens]|uniref:GNAT family N-acetyltransferase n=1 Tax=Streptomyces flavidovirens TaxID=67298 RepID=UPI00339E3FC4